jgi:hypothetical protein
MSNLIPRRPRSEVASYFAALRIYAPLGVWVATALSVAVWATAGVAGVAPVIGLVAGAGVLGAAAWLAARARSTWNETRRQILEDWSASIQPESTSTASMITRWNSAVAMLMDETGPQWVSGEGYVTVSRSLAEVEAAGMDDASAARLLDDARLDKMRLTGSSVDNRDALLADLNEAIKTLAAGAAAPAPPAVPATAPAASPTSTGVAGSAAVDMAAARSTVKQVRSAINDYRDSSRESLANLRRKTLDAVALAGALGYLLVIAGSANGSSAQKVQVASGAALFLVAAIVGVVAALNSMTALTKADDDFGLAGARLIATAVLSGLAGVAGVLLVYLSGTAGALVQAPAHAPQTLDKLFDVGTLPVTLVVAAVFGATPSLLITSLAKLGDRYATNLTSTHPTPTSTTGTTA